MKYYSCVTPGEATPEWDQDMSQTLSILPLVI